MAFGHVGWFWPIKKDKFLEFLNRTPQSAADNLSDNLRDRRRSIIGCFKNT